MVLEDVGISSWLPKKGALVYDLIYGGRAHLVLNTFIFGGGFSATHNYHKHCLHERGTLPIHCPRHEVKCCRLPLILIFIVEEFIVR